MAITRQRFARNGAFGGNVTVTFGSNITAGRALCIIAQTIPVSAPGTAGTISGATRVGGGAASSGWFDVFLYNNHPGGIATVPYVVGEASDYTAVSVWEVSAAAALEFESYAAQRQASPGTGTDAVSSGTASASDGTLVTGHAASDNGASLSAGTGFSLGTNNGAAPSGGGGSPLQYFGAESQIKSGAASLAATFTAGGSDAWYTAVAIFKETGGTTVTGSGAVALEAVQVAGAGVRQANGSGAISLEVAQVSGAGGVTRKGTGAIALAGLEVAGTGERAIPGSGAIVLPALGMAGAGEVSGSAAGTGSITLAALTLSGAGAVSRSGSGAITLSGIQVSGYDVPPTPSSSYKIIDGTAYDSTGRMITSFLGPTDPAPAGVRIIQGVAHGAGGLRYVTTWPTNDTKKLDGFALRRDGVQVIAPDTQGSRAIEGLPVTPRGELAATTQTPTDTVTGVGINAKRVSMTDTGP